MCLMFYIYLKLYNLIFYIYISARNYWLQLIIIMPLQSPHLTLSLYDYDIVLTIFVVFFSWELPTLITSIVTKCSSFQKSFSNVQIYIFIYKYKNIITACFACQKVTINDVLL